MPALNNFPQKGWMFWSLARTQQWFQKVQCVEGLAHQDKLGFQARTSELIFVSLHGSGLLIQKLFCFWKQPWKFFSAASGAPVSAQEFLWITALGLMSSFDPRIFSHKTLAQCCLSWLKNISKSSDCVFRLWFRLFSWTPTTPCQ